MIEKSDQIDYPFMPEAGQKYQHYKGGIYVILVAIAAAKRVKVEKALGLLTDDQN